MGSLTDEGSLEASGVRRWAGGSVMSAWRGGLGVRAGSREWVSEARDSLLRDFWWSVFGWLCESDNLNVGPWMG